MDKLPKQPLKKFNNNFDKIKLLFQTVFEWKTRSLLPTVQLDFSWTLKMSVDKMIRLQAHLRVRANFWMPCVLFENSSQNLFWMSLKFKMRHCKYFQCALSKISLHYQNVIDQRLTVFHQLFSWTSVGPSKCPIDKMIGLGKPSESLTNFLNAKCTIWELLHNFIFESH